MGQFLDEYRARPFKREDSGYTRSIFAPVAPEYTTGEVLLGGAYRKLLFGLRDAEIDLNDIDVVENALDPPELWRRLLSDDCLGSPVLSGRSSTSTLRQLMPLVPQLGTIAAVLGKKRGRWEPGNLLMQTMAAGLGPSLFKDRVNALQTYLQVDSGDDLFAQFVEHAIEPFSGKSVVAIDQEFPANAAWQRARGTNSEMTPSERFSDDLAACLELKYTLTRRQWLVLLESLLRLGLAMHYIWILRATSYFGDLVVEAAKGTPASIDETEMATFAARGHVDPLLTIGADGLAAIRRRIRSYVIGRIRVNLALTALKDAGSPWEGGLGSSNAVPPAEKLQEFLVFLSAHSAEVQVQINKTFDLPGIGAAAASLADDHQGILDGRSGAPKNIAEFIRYSLGQLQPADGSHALYDQAYWMFKKNRRIQNSPWLVGFGPAALVVMVHCTVKKMHGIPSSIEDFRSHLASYGFSMGADELSSGTTGSELSRLGLVIDSPDAGGGRLLNDPFAGVDR